MRPCSRSISSILPGCRRHLRTILSSGIGSTPASEAMTTWSSSVTRKRAGRRPLRSSVAPIWRPSVKAIAGRAVPRLHQGGVIFVEGLALGIHQRIAGPRLRDQHHHGVRQRVAAGDQQLERIVDAGGVGLAVRDDRPHLVEVGADQVGFHGAPAGIHPVDVAAHRVDLAVMGDEAVGMRQPPRREGVGREALMHQAERRLGQRIAQILVEALDLRRQQQALVDHGARGEGRHVELRPGRAACASSPDRPAGSGSACGWRGSCARRRPGRRAWRRGRRSPAGSPACARSPPCRGRRVGRHVAPAEQLLALDLDEMLEPLDRELPRLASSCGRKHMATA